MTDYDIVQATRALREPFFPDQIGKLPRVTCGACRDARGKVCTDHRKVQCAACRNYISERHIHLDYVGHAAVTDRLLSVDPLWTWEPLAFDAQTGLPVIEDDGGRVVLWIRLTVAGMTRLGVGTCEKTKNEPEKELIGDALRNAAMRFGVALDLWSKEDLRAADEDVPQVVAQEQNDATASAPDPRAGVDEAADPTVPNERDGELTEQVQYAVASLPEVVALRFRKWKGDQGFTWDRRRQVWPADQCAAMLRKIEQLVAEADERGEDPGSGAEPALPPADDLPTSGPCAYCGSTRSKRVPYRGEIRCSDGKACRKRAEAAADGSVAPQDPEPAPGPETTAEGPTGDVCAGCGTTEGLEVDEQLPGRLWCSGCKPL